MNFRIALLTLLLLPSPVPANDDASGRILETLQPGTITFVGETHKKKESILLIRNLLASIFQRNKCLTLALEIDERQQPVIDQVVEGEKPVSSIKIPVMIDHPELRGFIAGLANPDGKRCLKLIAIDTGIETQYDRNEWMAKNLAKLYKDNPILVPVGNLHILKRINWTVPTGTPAVAEILDRKGYRIRSFGQLWSPERCTGGNQRSSRFIDAEAPEALYLLNSKLISLMNAKQAKSAQIVIDGLIVWECTDKG